MTALAWAVFYLGVFALAALGGYIAGHDRHSSDRMIRRKLELLLERQSIQYAETTANFAALHDQVTDLEIFLQQRIRPRPRILRKENSPNRA